jgi:hypothetical protein
VGFPIRTSAHHRLVDASTQLFAVTHVLHRFLVPRHPPLALCSLEINSLGHMSELMCIRYLITHEQKCSHVKMLVLALQFSRSHKPTTHPNQTEEAETNPHSHHPQTGNGVRGPAGRLREGTNPSKRKRRRYPTHHITTGGTESLNHRSDDMTDAPMHQQVCVIPERTNVAHRQTGTP